jgi:hypothetical protein
MKVAPSLKSAWWLSVGFGMTVHVHCFRHVATPLSLWQLCVPNQGGLGYSGDRGAYIGRTGHHHTGTAAAATRGNRLRNKGLLHRMTVATSGASSLSSPENTPPRAVLNPEQQATLLECTTKSEVVAFLTPHLERVFASRDLVVVDVPHDAPWPLTFTNTDDDGERIDLPPLDLAVCHNGLDKQKDSPYSSTTCQPGVLEDWKERDGLVAVLNVNVHH